MNAYSTPISLNIKQAHLVLSVEVSSEDLRILPTQPTYLKQLPAEPFLLRIHAIYLDESHLLGCQCRRDLRKCVCA